MIVFVAILCVCVWGGERESFCEGYTADVIYF